MRRYSAPLTVIKYLGDAQASQRMLWVFCVSCGHATQCHPWVLIQKGSLTQTLEEAEKRCRCRRCGAKDAKLMLSRTTVMPR